ncbi:MAG: hypothetical protein ACREQ7_01825 [Candidatus Binatia bacterium]
MKDYCEEDVGNILLLEHVNLQVPDQSVATLFYVVGLGLTRDPYLNVGLENMWINMGEQQFHLPTRAPQVIHGRIGLVVPNLETLEQRLALLGERLQNTRFGWMKAADHIDVTCPWGNNIRCHPSGSASFGDMALGLAYVEFLVAAGAALSIGRFYERVLGAAFSVTDDPSGLAARVKIGRNQALIFRESGATSAYDGHHIAIYIGNFSRPYGLLKERGLVTEDVRNHQFRFQDVIDIEDGRRIFQLEHEVRSLHHPMYGRFFVNRDGHQTQRNYRRGRDALVPFSD